MYGFFKIGKQQKQGTGTITLTPADATLISGGKPVFEVYYGYREYNGVVVPGPFKNKIFFDDTLVSGTPVSHRMSGSLVSQQTGRAFAYTAFGREIEVFRPIGLQPIPRLPRAAPRKP